MIMRGDQEMPLPEKEAIFLAHWIFPWAFSTRTQWHIFLHHETSIETLSLLSSEIPQDSLEVFPASALGNEAGVVPVVLCRFDVVLDDERPIAELAG